MNDCRRTKDRSLGRTAADANRRCHRRHTERYTLGDSDFKAKHTLPFPVPDRRP